jgi:hypothetical protein
MTGRPVVICPACKHDIHNVFSCIPNDSAYLFGSEPGYERPPTSALECRDCAVTIGGTHHIWCCVAQCRLCTENHDPADSDVSGQWLGCRHQDDHIVALGIEDELP